MMDLAGDEKGCGRDRLALARLQAQPPAAAHDRQPFQPKGLPDEPLTLVIGAYQVIVSLPSRIS